MARIGSEADFGARPDACWGIVLRGGPNDGEVVEGWGYWDSPPRGMWVLEVEKTDVLAEECGRCHGRGVLGTPIVGRPATTCSICEGSGQRILVAERLREPAQLRYELRERKTINYEDRLVVFDYVADG